MKLGIIGSGMIVHDFLTTADQIKNLELTAISSTKRSAGIGTKIWHPSKLYWQWRINVR